MSFCLAQSHQKSFITVCCSWVTVTNCLSMVHVVLSIQNGNDLRVLFSGRALIFFRSNPANIPFKGVLYKNQGPFFKPLVPFWMTHIIFHCFIRIRMENCYAHLAWVCPEYWSTDLFFSNLLKGAYPDLRKLNMGQPKLDIIWKSVSSQL